MWKTVVDPVKYNNLRPDNLEDKNMCYYIHKNENKSLLKFETKSIYLDISYSLSLYFLKRREFFFLNVKLRLFYFENEPFFIIISTYY